MMVLASVPRRNPLLGSNARIAMSRHFRASCSMSSGGASRPYLWMNFLRSLRMSRLNPTTSRSSALVSPPCAFSTRARSSSGDNISGRILTGRSPSDMGLQGENKRLLAEALKQAPVDGADVEQRYGASPSGHDQVPRVHALNVCDLPSFLCHH